jgi:hypothetical protein
MQTTATRRRVGDVVYGPTMTPAVVVEAADRDGNLTVLLTVGQDAGRRVPLAAHTARPVQGYGAHQRITAARDYAWLHGETLPARPRREVAEEAARCKSGGHRCVDIDWCSPGADHRCATAAQHLAALRVEWKAGR